MQTSTAGNDDDGAVARRSRPAPRDHRSTSPFGARRGPISSSASSSGRAITDLPSMARQALARFSPRRSATPDFGWQGRASDGRPEEGHQALRPQAEAQAEAGVRRHPARRRSRATEEAGARRHEDRRLSARRRPGHQRRRRKLVRVAREPLDPGLVVAGEVRDIPGLARRSMSSSPRTSCRGRTCGSASARTASASAPRRHGIDDERQLGNAVAVPRPRGSLDPDGSGGPRLPPARHDDLGDRRSHAPRRPRRRLSRADRPLRRRLPRGEHRAHRDRRRGFRAPTRRRAHAPVADGEGDEAHRRRRHRSRPLDARDLGWRDLRLHARARVGRCEARRRDRSRARSCCRTKPRAEAFRRPSRRRLGGGDTDDPRLERAGKRSSANS